MSIKTADKTAPRQISAVIPWDVLQLAIAGAVILLLLVPASEQVALLVPFRAALGALYILFVPGFFLGIALFPRRDDLDTPARIGLSIGLSIAVVPLLALLLDKLPWGIRLWPILIGECGVIAVAIAVGIWRIARLPAGMAYPPPIGWQPRRWWSGLRADERRTYAGLASALLLASIAIGWIFLVPGPGTFMTEFYMLGKAGMAEDYPQHAAAGEQLNATLGIANHERAEQTYRVEVWVTDRWDPSRHTQVAHYAPITLAVGQEQQLPISWRMPWAGPDQQVELLLFAGDGPEPYRRLKLWVNVE